MIEEFIKEKERIVTKEEIKEKFKGVTEIVINLATTGNPNILVWDFSKYLHVDHLSIKDTEKLRFKKLLD
jgi:hypothetical protein